MNRSPDHRRGQTQLAIESTDTAAHLGAGHEGRDAGYQERGGPVQFAGDGARRVGGGGGFDTHWVGGGRGCSSLILGWLVRFRLVVVRYNGCIYMMDWIWRKAAGYDGL